MEEFVSGYCRVLDAARTVLADTQEGTADCSYPDCVYAPQCQLALRFRVLFGEEPEKNEKK